MEIQDNPSNTSRGTDEGALCIQSKVPSLLTDQNVTYCVCRNESLELDKNFHENPSNISPDILEKVLHSPGKVPFIIVRS